MVTLEGEIEKLLAEHADFKYTWDEDSAVPRGHVCAGCGVPVGYQRGHQAEVIAKWMLGAQIVYEELAECADLEAKYIEFFRHFDSSGAHTAARWLRGIAKLIKSGTTMERRWGPFMKK